MQLNQHYPERGTREFDNVLQEFKETFLDQIFENDSSKSRPEFLNNLALKATWIFESEEIRTKWDALCSDFEPQETYE